MQWLCWGELSLRRRNRLRAFNAECWAALRGNKKLRRTLKVLWVDCVK